MNKETIELQARQSLNKYLHKRLPEELVKRMNDEQLKEYMKENTVVTDNRLTITCPIGWSETLIRNLN